MITPNTPATKAARCETIHQAKRWDINKNKAAQLGLCDPCAAQYAWGLIDGFSTVHPPCPDCSEIVATAIGAVKPNGWRVLPRIPRHTDTGNRSGAPGSRHMTPGMGVDGYGSCLVCGDHWSGFAVCHCSGCHHTFTDLGAFDQHRVGTHARRSCADPATVGLIKITRPHWTGWGHPVDTPIA